MLTFHLDNGETPNGETFWLFMAGSLMMMLDGVFYLLANRFWKQEEERVVAAPQYQLPEIPAPAALDAMALFDQSFTNSTSNLIAAEEGPPKPRVFGRRHSQRMSRMNSVHQYYNQSNDDQPATTIQTLRDSINFSDSMYRAEAPVYHTDTPSY
jgi:uncharacterized protein YjeT (DUF2065 family)